MLTRLTRVVVARLKAAAELVNRALEATEPTSAQQYDDYVRENR